MQAIVTIHGALSNSADMEMALAGVLGDCKVLHVDRPGRGHKTAWGSVRPVQRQARQLRAEARSAGVERPVLVGHSFGAAVALSWAMQYPSEVRGVVALAPIAFPEFRLEHLVFGPRGIPVIGRMWSTGARIFADPLLIPEIRRQMFKPQRVPEGYAERVDLGTRHHHDPLVAEGEDALQMVQGLAVNAVGYSRCNTPVRILVGDADGVVNKEAHSRRLCSMLPEARLEELPGLGHMLHHFAATRIRDAVDCLSR